MLFWGEEGKWKHAETSKLTRSKITNKALVNYFAHFIMSTNSGKSDAPPTRNPSMLGQSIRDTQLFPFTDPPYTILIAFAIAGDTFVAIH